MTQYSQVIEQIALSNINRQIARPSPATVVEALLAAEKQARKNRVSYQFEQLLGTWRLSFITGTQSVRQGAGKVIGAGKYIPGLVDIKLSYLPNPDTKSKINKNDDYQIKNQVSLFGLKFCLQGPVKFLPKRNIVAFDFTRIAVELLGVKVYQGSIRNGKAKEQSFYTDSIQTQAFFSYFWVQSENPTVPAQIAARGRGGGLAIWTRSD